MSPGVLAHGLDDDDAEEDDEVEAFADVGARHQEQVALVELFKDAALQLHKLINNKREFILLTKQI